MGAILDIAGTLLNPLSAVINWIATAQQNKKQRKWEAQQSDLAWQRDKEMFAMTNEYNSPASQMERYEAAGLNPNLVVGQGTSGNASASMPKYQKPDGKFGLPLIDLTGMLSMYMDVQVKQQQIDTMKTMQEKAKQETTLKVLDQALKSLELDYKPKEYEFKTKGFKYDLDSKRLGVDMKKKEIDIAAQRLDLTKAQAQWAMKKLYEMEQSGINIDRAPYWLTIPKALLKKAVENFSESGHLSDMPGPVTYEGQ